MSDHGTVVRDFRETLSEVSNRNIVRAGQVTCSPFLLTPDIEQEDTVCRHLS
jgi:hypothetical protein